MVSYSVVIPVYNSTDSLLELSQSIDMVFRNSIKEEYEIIFVDDGSPNSETWPSLLHICEKYETVTAIQLMRNFGKPGATICGLKQAKGKYIFLMDDDLQHLPGDFPEFIKKNSHDVVIGYFPKKKHNFFKRQTSNLKGWFDKRLIGKPKNIKNSPFVLLQRNVVEAIINIKTTHPFISALIFNSTKDIVNVKLQHGKRKYGKSGYTLYKLLKQFSNLLINNSSFLLRIVAYTGFSFSLFSFLYGLFLIIKRILVGSANPGWTSIMVLLLFTSGLILLSVGIVGEYLIRIIHGIEQKPAFIIRKIV